MKFYIVGILYSVGLSLLAYILGYSAGETAGFKLWANYRHKPDHSFRPSEFDPNQCDEIIEDSGSLIFDPHRCRRSKIEHER